MKFLKIIIVSFIFFQSTVKADLNENLVDSIRDGGKLIFIRHAYAPGNGDPQNFNLNDCAKQRNLSEKGKNQAKKIGIFFTNHGLDINEIYSSEWCRCKETALIAFNEFKTKKFLNSFYSLEFSKNRGKQKKEFKKFLKTWNKKHNLVFITHYVVISDILNYSTSSGEIVVTDKNLKVIASLEIEY